MAILRKALAWRHHLVGDIAMLLYSPVLLAVAWFIMVASERHQEVSRLVLAALVFPVGAALHFAA